MKYIDIHGHINFPDYDTDRAQVIGRANDLDVGIVIVGTDLESSRQAIELAHKNKNMWAVIGQHPTENNVFEYDQFLVLAKDPKVVAIGECGLDYFHSKPEEMSLQRENFLQHIKIANEVNKPLMLHIREAKKAKGQDQQKRSDIPSVGAYLESISILRQYAKVKSNFHFFAGSIDDVKAGLDIGASFSFTGVVTFTKDYDEAIKAIPLENIMTETDCPFVAPTPHRGKRNEPSYVVEVVKSIARIKGLDEKVVAESVVENAKRFFGI